MGQLLVEPNQHHVAAPESTNLFLFGNKPYSFVLSIPNLVLLELNGTIYLREC